LRLKGRRRNTEREVSRGCSSQPETALALITCAGEGPNERKSETTVSPQDARRQKPTQLGLPLQARGETPSEQRSGEASTLTNGKVRSGNDQLMEQVVARGNVRGALARVRENRGSPGVDGMTVEELPQYLMEHWQEVREQLLAGTYQPKPVLRQEIPKRDGGVRELGIPCGLDRLIQQAILQVLQPRFDPSFSEHSSAYSIPICAALRSTGVSVDCAK
jgi:hypothetical protein